MGAEETFPAMGHMEVTAETCIIWFGERWTSFWRGTWEDSARSCPCSPLRKACLSELSKPLELCSGHTNVVTASCCMQLSTGEHGTPWYPSRYHVNLAVPVLHGSALRRYICWRCKLLGKDHCSRLSLQNWVRRITKFLYLLSPSKHQGNSISIFL